MVSSRAVPSICCRSFHEKQNKTSFHFQCIRSIRSHQQQIIFTWAKTQFSDCFSFCGKQRCSLFLLAHKPCKDLCTYIVKPDAGSQGEGIYLVNDPRDVQRFIGMKPAVVQVRENYDNQKYYFKSACLTWCFCDVRFWCHDYPGTDECQSLITCHLPGPSCLRFARFPKFL